MPTYEYRCKSCDYYFEQFQSIKDDPVKICPQCGGSVRKLFSPGAGLIFKGSGFYITDYKNNKPAPSSNGQDKTKDPDSSHSPEKKSIPEKKEVSNTKD
jgi:putative FmdB family regulatory protein